MEHFQTTGTYSQVGKQAHLLLNPNILHIIQQKYIVNEHFCIQCCSSEAVKIE